MFTDYKKNILFVFYLTFGFKLVQGHPPNSRSKHKNQALTVFPDDDVRLNIRKDQLFSKKSNRLPVKKRDAGMPLICFLPNKPRRYY